MASRSHEKAIVGLEILPFDLGFLPPFYAKKAEAEMNDVEETRQRCIRELRDAIKGGDDTIRDIQFSDDFLLQHLRTRTFNVSRAFTAVKEFVNLTIRNPEMFSGFSYSETVKAIQDKILTVLPIRCHDGCMIVYVQIGNWNTSTFPLEEIKRLLVVVMTQALRDPMTQVCGIKAIIDIQSDSIKYLLQCTLSNLLLLYHATQHCVPGKYKGVHVVNYNILFKSVWLIAKNILPRKLQNRVHLHRDPKKLFDFFHRACIPEKYGGDLVVTDQSEWLKRMMSPEQLAYIGGGALNPL